MTRRIPVLAALAMVFLAAASGATAQVPSTDPGAQDLTGEDEAATLESPGRYAWSPDWWLEPVEPVAPLPPVCSGPTYDALPAERAEAVEPSVVCLDGAAAPDEGSLDAGESQPELLSPTTPETLAYETSLAEPLPAEAPGATADASVTAAAVRSDWRGFNTGQLVGWTDAEINEALRQMEASGSTVHRLTILWADIQPDNGTQWEGGAYDTIITRANARGLRLILNPMGSPNWARIDRRKTVPYGTFGRFAYPDKVDAWGNFIKQLATRYDPEGFEIWNEQNSLAFWDPTLPISRRESPNPTRWTRLFCRAASEIRSVRRPENVGMGGLAPHFNNSYYDHDRNPNTPMRLRNMRASEYLRRAYSAGMSACTPSFVGYHPYLINRYCVGSEDRGVKPINEAGAIQELRAVRGVMVARGHGTRKIWNTEWGFPSATFRVSLNPPVDCRYTPARQAEMIRREHNYLIRLPYMRFSAYFNIRDASEDPYFNAFHSVGMIRFTTAANWDSARKPSYGVWSGLP